MSHVKIASSTDGGHTLIVDGVDLSMEVIADSLSIQFHDSADSPTVTMTVVADTLDVDLPEAVIETTEVTE